MSNIEKFNQRAQAIDSLVCVGLDSAISKIAQRFQSAKFPQFAFNKWIIQQTHPHAAAYKPNLAYYEARGDQGMRELKETVDYLKEHHPDIFLIADAKRADIGTTNEGYVEAIFDWFGFDAITLHPYLGREALAPFLERDDKTSIVLCRTSNPGAGEFQDRLVDGKPMWQVVAESVRDSWNDNNNCMLVVGATYPTELATLRQLMGDMTFLVPGIGAQGGDVEATVTGGVNSESLGIIVNAARSIIFSQNPQEEAEKLQGQVNEYR